MHQANISDVIKLQGKRAHATRHSSTKAQKHKKHKSTRAQKYVAQCHRLHRTPCSLAEACHDHDHDRDHNHDRDVMDPAMMTRDPSSSDGGGDGEGGDDSGDGATSDERRVKE